MIILLEESAGNIVGGSGEMANIFIECKVKYPTLQPAAYQLHQLTPEKTIPY